MHPSGHFLIISVCVCVCVCVCGGYEYFYAMILCAAHGWQYTQHTTADTDIHNPPIVFKQWSKLHIDKDAYVTWFAN